MARTTGPIPFGQVPRPAKVRAFSTLLVFRYSSKRCKSFSAHWRPNQLCHSRAAELSRHGLGPAKTVRGHGKVETTQLYAEKDVASAMELVSGSPRLA